MSEFEDQINQLGELPEDISGEGERNELQNYGREGSGHVSIPPSTGGVPVALNPPTGVPSDIAVENRIRGMDGPPGSPTIPANVTTTWDARPINARDFIHTERGVVSVDRGDPETFVLINNFSFTVPQGYIGVLRGFSYRADSYMSFGPAGADGGGSFTPGDYLPVSSTLLVDSIVVPDYENMNLGQSVSYFLPTFVIALPGQQFILRTVHDESIVDAFSITLGNVDASFGVFAQLHGQLLLSRGLPKQFEIMTQNWSGRENR